MIMSSSSRQIASRLTAAAVAVLVVVAYAGPATAAADRPVADPVQPAPAGAAQAAVSSPDRPAGGPSASAADGEVVSLRTATSRTFRLKGGRLQARIASRPINYQDAQGRWQKSDNSLASDGAGRRSNRANSYRLDLPRDAADGPVTVRVGGDAVGFQLINARAEGVAAGDTMTYPGALPGVDLSYQALDGGVKEIVTLDSAAAGADFDFATTLSKGLTLRSTADGGLAAVGSDGQPRLSYVPPNVEDSSGRPDAFSTSAVRMTVSGPDRAPTVRLSVDPAWLHDPARVFPVRIDPYYDTGAAAQTYLNSTATTTNYSTQTTLRVGKDTTGAVNNAIVQFDTSPVPRSAEVYFTSLNLDVSSADAGAAGTTLQAKALTRAFTASAATWTKATSTVNWTTAGGDVTSTGLDSRPYTATSMSLYPLDMVKSWVNGGSANHGLQLSSTSTTTGSSVAFAKTTGASPYLYIEYIHRTGDQGQYTYTRQDLTDRAELAVNVSSGNLLLSNDDLSVAGPGGGLSIGRFYNSKDSVFAPGPLPAGWNQSPGTDELVDRAVVPLWRGPTGTAFAFRKPDDITNPHGAYPPAPGSGVDLFNDTAAGVTITDRTSRQVRTFDGGGKLISVTDRNGNVTRYDYDDPNSFHVGHIVDAAGRSTTLAYNDKLVSMTDSSGRVSAYGYDALMSYLTSYTDPAGKVTTYGYNAAGLLSQIVTPAGRKTNLVYDTQGRVTSIMRVTSLSGTDTGPTTTYAYTDSSVTYTDSMGTVHTYPGKTVVTDANSKATTHYFDPSGRVLRTVDALGRNRSRGYTVNSDVNSAVDGLGTGTSAGNTTTSTFDGDHRATGSTSPTGGASTLTYAETAGTVTNAVAHWQPNASTDSDGNKAAFTYDGPGNLTKTQDTTNGPTGGVQSTFTYNPPAPAAALCGGKFGQVCSATDGRGKITSYTYDGSGNQTAVDNPAPLGDTSATYDTIGRVVNATDGKGQVTRTTHDNLDRITQVRFNGATTCTSTDITNGLCITYGYDDDGNQTSMVDQSGTSTWTYDKLGRETARSLPSTGSTSLTYDGVGNVLTATDAAGTISYTYSAANELLTLLEPGGSCAAAPKDRCTTFGYNNNGARITTTYPTGTTSTVMTTTLDNAGRVSNIKALTGTTRHSDFSYTYSRMVGSTATDGALVRTRVENNAAGSADKTTTYTLDSLDRLTLAEERNTSNAVTASWSYGYDNAGNRTSATLGPLGTGGTTAFTYNDANQILTRAGSSAGWAYDLNGAETDAVGSTTRTAGAWNPKLQNTSVTAGSAYARTYTGAGNKTRLSAGGTTYRNTALGITAETTAGVTTTYVRDPGGTLVATRTSNTSHYYVFDGLGSVVALINPAGGKANSYSYDPYGQARSSGGTVVNPYRYTGGYLDTSTGLYKLGIRYYDPALGRFTQPDPTEQDDHYTYANDNPVSFVDPDGEAFFLPAIVIGARIAAPYVARAAARYGPKAASWLSNGNNAVRIGRGRVSLGPAMNHWQRMSPGMQRLARYHVHIERRYGGIDNWVRGQNTTWWRNG